MKDQILFIPGRYKYDGNHSSTNEDLIFISLSPTPSLPLRRTPRPTVEDDNDLEVDEAQLPLKDGSDLSLESSNSDDDPFRKRTLPTPRGAASQKNADPDFLDIHEISADAFFLNAKNKANKLFYLIMNEINTPLPLLRPYSGLKVGRNNRYLSRSNFKYKKYYRSNSSTLQTVDISAINSLSSSVSNLVNINETDTLTLEEIKKRLPEDYHDYINVFDRTKADNLPPHRPYDYKLEFIDNIDKSRLPRSRIYLILGYKLKQVKKYLDEYLKKGFIVPSKAPFASLVLFAEKPNGGLRFYVDYRRLN